MDTTTNVPNYLALFCKTALGLAVVCVLSGVGMLSKGITFPPLTADTAAPFGWHLLITGAVLGFWGALPYLPPAGRWTRLALSLLGLGIAGIVAFPNLAIPFRILTEFSLERAWLLLLAVPGLVCALAYFLVAALLPQFKPEDDEQIELSEEPSDTELVEALSIPHTGGVLTLGIRNSVYIVALMAFMTYGFAAAYLYKDTLETVLFEGSFVGWDRLTVIAVKVAENVTPLALVGVSIAPIFVTIEWFRRADALRVLKSRDDAGRPFGQVDKEIAKEGAKRLRALAEQESDPAGWGVTLLGLGAFLAPLLFVIWYISAMARFDLQGFLSTHFMENRVPDAQPFLYIDGPGAFEGAMLIFAFPFGAWLAYASVSRSRELAYRAFFSGQRETTEQLLGRLFQILGFAIRSGQITDPNDTDPKELIGSWFMRWQPWLTKVCLIWLSVAAVGLVADRSHYTLLTAEQVTYSRYGSFSTQTEPLSNVERLVIECRNAKDGDLMVEWRLEMPGSRGVNFISNTDILRALTDEEIRTLVSANALLRASNVAVVETDTRADFERMVVDDQCDAGLLELFTQEKANITRPLFRLTH